MWFSKTCVCTPASTCMYAMLTYLHISAASTLHLPRNNASMSIKRKT